MLEECNTFTNTVLVYEAVVLLVILVTFARFLQHIVLHRSKKSIKQLSKFQRYGAAAVFTFYSMTLAFSLGNQVSICISGKDTPNELTVPFGLYYACGLLTLLTIFVHRFRLVVGDSRIISHKKSKRIYNCVKISILLLLLSFTAALISFIIQASDYDSDSNCSQAHKEIQTNNCALDDSSAPWRIFTTICVLIYVFISFSMLVLFVYSLVQIGRLLLTYVKDEEQRRATLALSKEQQQQSQQEKNSKQQKQGNTGKGQVTETDLKTFGMDDENYSKGSITNYNYNSKYTASGGVPLDFLGNVGLKAMKQTENKKDKRDKNDKKDVAEAQGCPWTDDAKEINNEGSTVFSGDSFHFDSALSSMHQGLTKEFQESNAVVAMVDDEDDDGDDDGGMKTKNEEKKMQDILRSPPTITIIDEHGHASSSIIINNSDAKKQDNGKNKWKDDMHMNVQQEKTLGKLIENMTAYTVLVSIGLFSTLCNMIEWAVVDLDGTFVITTDILINSICLYLQFPFSRDLYSLLCNCCHLGIEQMFWKLFRLKAIKDSVTLTKFYESSLRTRNSVFSKRMGSKERNRDKTVTSVGLSNHKIVSFNTSSFD